MHNPSLFGKGTGFADNPIAEPRSDHHQEVTIVHGYIGHTRSVHPDHSGEPRVHRIDRTMAHQRDTHRAVDLFQEFGQLGLGIGKNDSSTHIQHRLGGFLDQLDRLLQGTGLDMQVVGNIPLDLHFGILGFGSSDILGNIDQHRAGPPLSGDMEGLPYRGCQFLDILYNIVVFGDRHGDTADIDLLETILAQQLGRNVPGEGNHGNRIHVCGSQAGDQVCRSRTTGGEHHADFSRRAGIAVRSMRRALFMAGQDMANRIPVLVQSIVSVEYSTPGEPKNGIDTLFLEASDNYLSSIQLHMSISLSQNSANQLS